MMMRITMRILLVTFFLYGLAVSATAAAGNNDQRKERRLRGLRSHDFPRDYLPLKEPVNSITDNDEAKEDSNKAENNINTSFTTTMTTAEESLESNERESNQATSGKDDMSVYTFNSNNNQQQQHEERQQQQQEEQQESQQEPSMAQDDEENVMTAQEKQEYQQKESDQFHQQEVQPHQEEQQREQEQESQERQQEELPAGQEEGENAILVEGKNASGNNDIESAITPRSNERESEQQQQESQQQKPPVAQNEGEDIIVEQNNESQQLDKDRQQQQELPPQQQQQGQEYRQSQEQEQLEAREEGGNVSHENVSENNGDNIITISNNERENEQQQQQEEQQQSQEFQQQDLSAAKQEEENATTLHEGEIVIENNNENISTALNNEKEGIILIPPQEDEEISHNTLPQKITPDGGGTRFTFNFHGNTDSLERLNSQRLREKEELSKKLYEDQQQSEEPHVEQQQPEEQEQQDSPAARNEGGNVIVASSQEEGGNVVVASSQEEGENIIVAPSQEEEENVIVASSENEEGNVVVASSQDEGDTAKKEEVETSSVPSSFRVATFGSSRTWGAGIPDRNQNSYTALLNGTNYGIRGSGPEYPAMCLYSMIGDDNIYDVIVIEFMLDWVTRALDELAERLRHRFPKSTIIFLNYWAPRQYIYKPNGQSFQEFHREQIANKDPSMSGSDHGFQPWVLDGTHPDDWIYEPYDRDVILEAAKKVDGYIIDLPQLMDPIHTMKTFGDLYITDMTHFSLKGHLFIHDEINSLLWKLNKLDNHASKEPTIVDKWDSTDYCTLWYENGKTDYPTTMDMVEFKPNKFALEARNDTFNNKIEIFNPWEGEGHLYLSYMATGPDAMYPRAIARVLHQPDNKETAGFVMNTHIPGVGHNKLHIVMHWMVGPVKPGKSDLLIHIADSLGGPYPWPVFRLVGVMLSPRKYDDDGSGRVSANF
mmetsp:Transcript_14621/g.16251  ORF Transcript_14621/g.16251 Transcript_14621/m.16251 type:complete len:943 (-) Transcript_14621:178-3006(-)